MRVADAIFKRLREETDTVYYLPGGGASHLVDALGQSGLRAVCALHEQGAGYMAVAHAQLRGFAVVLTTSGPGATNAVTPCLGAYLDSVPVLFISGQVATGQLAMIGQRSRGTQEGPTLAIVKPMTKLARMLDKAGDARWLLDLLIRETRTGRPGAVWLDIPNDIQAAEL